jgi:cell division septum initiation protein DivIVA
VPTPPVGGPAFPRLTRPGLRRPHHPPARAASNDDRHQAAPSVPARSAFGTAWLIPRVPTMTNDSELMPDLGQEDAFEVQMRGYSRRQVDEYVARTRSQIHDLEERLSRSLDEAERVRLDLSTARQDLSNKPAHEEISERVGQILKLADDEAKAQRMRAQDEIVKQRDDAKKETERHRTEAREQTERMLTAAQEQAENAIATARAEAEKLRNSARIESERAVGDATKEAEAALASAKAQAKQMLDEATMRATAIHDGAERRLNLLTSRHTETMRRLTEIRDVVTNLVSSETARGSLEEEVAKSVATSVAAGAGPVVAPAARAADGGRPAPGGPQLPGRGGRDAAPERSAPEAARATPARAAQRAGDSAEEPPGRTAAPASDSPAAPKPAPRPTSTGGGAHAGGTRPNNPPE